MRYKKKRKPGPSKNIMKVRRRETEERAGSGATLSQVHPEVTHITIQLSVTSPQNVLITEETRRFSSSDTVDFSCECPGTCGVGKFNFSEKIGLMVAAQEAKSEASGACEVRVAGFPKPCGHIAKCGIEIAYKAVKVPEDA